MNESRLDQFLAAQGLVPSRERARAYIMEGLVYVNGEKAEKPGQPVAPNAHIEVRGGLAYVSRGGLKLEKAMEVFPVALEGRVCMDVGASTGGFTDCMLQNGAAKVYAVDVGYGQLAWKLRCDERVINLERTNIRHLDVAKIDEKIDFFSVDVSFISLKHVFPVMQTLVKPGGIGVCLVKPQFEAGREKVGKHGVVRDEAVHCEVLETVQRYATENGFSPEGVSYSPITGPKGNIEFLLFVRQTNAPLALQAQAMQQVVRQAHNALHKEDKSS